MTEGNYSNVGHRGPVYKGLGAMNPCDLSMVRDITWRIGHGSEKFRLIALSDRYVGSGGAAPQFNFVCPNWFENSFINQYIIFQC
jgi:hypothetical protein